MKNIRIAKWVLGIGLLNVPSLPAVAETPQAPMTAAVATPATWETPESLRGYTPRSFQTDGTTPATSKGREAKVDVKLEVQTASLDSPVAGIVNVTPLPRMPHGFLDPTHPAGAAEPGSAAPLQMPKRKPGPYTSGFTIVQIRRTTR